VGIHCSVHVRAMGQFSGGMLAAGAHKPLGGLLSRSVVSCRSRVHCAIGCVPTITRMAMIWGYLRCITAKVFVGPRPFHNGDGVSGTGVGRPSWLVASKASAARQWESSRKGIVGVYNLL